MTTSAKQVDQPSERHRYAGEPFVDDDAVIAAALEEVTIPTLLCSMVHLTGDPSWIRGEHRPAAMFLNEYQGFMSPEAQDAVRKMALPVILRYRDDGCVLPRDQPDDDLVREMMEFLAAASLPDDVLPMVLDELGLGDPDPNRVAWRDAITTDARTEFPVVVIGCGQSGLLTGIRLQEAGVPFTIIEKNSGPGGTWWENRYPGARVDVGSHFYCYSFEPAHHWTEYFSQQPELAQYFSDVLHKHRLEERCRFDTEVVSAAWDDNEALWSVEVRSDAGDIEVLKCRALISSVGSLNRPKLPDIDGIDSFDGPAFHSARWDHTIDLEGKRVAMVGAGASGFQIAPAIADTVEHLTVFQRTAQWMLPNANYHEPVPDGQKWALRHLPFFGRWFRFQLFWPASGGDMSAARIDPNFDDSDGLAVSESNLATRGWFEGWIREQVGDDPELLAQVIPDYPATGKRTLQDNGSWLQCLKRDDVDLVRTAIECIEPGGVRTADGTLHEIDVIVFATGFHQNRFLWPMHITGRDAAVLSEVWGDEPQAHLGITVPGFPNLFCVYGPGTHLAHGGSLIFQSECQVAYVMGCIDLLLAEGHSSMEPRQDRHDAYNARRAAEIKTLVWSHWSIEHSYFKNADGDIFTVSPWPLHVYQQWTKSPDPDDFKFVPSQPSS